MRLSLLALLVLFPSINLGGDAPTATIEAGWIIAAQGNDETSQVLRVKIWGSLPQEDRFVQLDQDPELEFVVISRNSGTGPYYKLQIHDFVKHGVLTWSFDSMGRPKIENRFVWLGDQIPYEGAGTVPSYRKYAYSTAGLQQLDD